MTACYSILMKYFYMDTKQASGDGKSRTLLLKLRKMLACS